MATGEDWTRLEVEAAVVSYLAMLRRELLGEQPSRKAHWEPLTRSLEGRSKGSVEYKFGNISAALFDLGLPYSDGYQPYGHRQGLVDEVVQSVVAADPAFIDFAATSAGSEEPDALLRLPREPASAEVPRPEGPLAETAHERSAAYLPRKVDFAAIEAGNRSLGLAGERWVVELERRRLLALGATALAGQVEHASQQRGDGLGYDVLSFEPDGSPRHVEVKTTRSGRLTPFLVTARERAFSRECAASYRLYRVFTFTTKPRFFQLPGDLEDSCRRLVPQAWRAWP